MGGGGDTTRTLDEIKADLRAQLNTNARKELRDLGGSPGDQDDLVKTVPEIAERQFWKTYGYGYNGNPTDKGNPEVIPVPRTPELCDVVPPVSSQVTWYLNTQVFSHIDITDPTIKQKAINDLHNHIYGIVTHGGTDNQWVNSSYNNSYDATENDGQRSVKCDSTLIYVYGNLLEDGTRAEIAFICFCGVYYTVDSPTVEARRAIEADAYETALPVLGADYPQKPTNHAELAVILQGRSMVEFQSHFGYPFSPGSPGIAHSYPPDSYRARGAFSAQFTLNSALHVIPDPKPGVSLESYIEQLYMGLNIPTKSIRDEAKQNTARQYDIIIQNSRGNDRSWVTDRIDQTFDASDVSVNKTRQTGILKSWYGHQTTHDTTISMLFIHIITMVYELEDSVAAQERDLFNILGNQLRKEKVPESEDIPYLDLEAWAKDYTHEEFKKKFEFEHEGSKSVVPEKGIGIVIPFSSFFRLKKHPATGDEVLEWIHRTVLSKGNSVPARDEIIDAIRNDVVRGVNDDNVKINSWYTTGTPDSGQIFEKTGDRGSDMQLRSYYLFVHGNLQVGENPEPTERVIVFALGVITTWKDPWAPEPQTSGTATAAVAPARAIKEYQYIPPRRVSA